MADGTPRGMAERREHASFDASWLALREPADHRSRSEELVPPLRSWWTAVKARRVVDLGSGTGSNLRYLAPRLPGPQEWILVDRDAELLALADPPGDHVEVRRVPVDLGDLGPAEAKRSDLVTGSAILDLVSEVWLSRLADRCLSGGAAACFALTYDGGFRWWADEARTTPLEGPDDAPVRNAVNAHQRQDKGLGPALGPGAAKAADRLFRERGYRTRLFPSPWSLGPEEGSLVQALLEGWEAAALEADPDRAEHVREWADRRREAIRGGAFAVTVGHLDLLALPPGPADLR